MSTVNIYTYILTILISIINLSKSQLSYDGPIVSSSAFFQQELLESSIDTTKLPELVCNSIEDSWYYLFYGWVFSANGTSYYTDETTNDSLVHYYKLSVTSDMKTSYTSALSLSTCCDLDICAYTNETKEATCNYGYQDYWIFWYEIWGDYYYGYYDTSTSSTTSSPLSTTSNNATTTGTSSPNSTSATTFDPTSDPTADPTYDPTWYPTENPTTFRRRLQDSQGVIDSYCSSDSGTALDTVLYILQEKKGKINIIYEQDDSSCSNTQHSYIDLSTLTEGDYIVAVGGYGTEFGKYLVHLDCVKYRFPIEENQFEVPENTSNITDGETLKGKVNSTTVAYHRFYVTDESWLPISIRSNNKNASYWSYEYWYIITPSTNNVNGYEYEIIDSGFAYQYSSVYYNSYYNYYYDSNYYDSNYYGGGDNDTDSSYYRRRLQDSSTYGFLIDEDNKDQFPNGEYYIVIQSPYEELSYNIELVYGPPPTESPTDDPTISPSNYPSVSPTLAPTEAPKLDRNVMVGLVFGSMGFLMFLMVGYYIYESVKYHKDKPSQREPPSKVGPGQSHKAIASGSVGANMGTAIEMGTPMTGGDSSSPGEYTKKPSIEPVKVKSNESDDDAEELQELQEPIPEEKDMEPEPQMLRPTSRREGGAAVSVAGVDVRRLDKDRSIVDQMGKDEDVVQVVLAHAIDCCNEGEQFDIFQVLAIRYFHEPSRKVIGTGMKPLARCGINWEIIKLSPYVTTLFVALITGLTQTWGTTVVVWKLMDSYFEDGVNSVECDMTEERWANVISLKVLALLLSLVVTFFIGVLLSGVKHNGLYEIVDTLELQHFKRVQNVQMFFVQFGQFVNYWVALFAILGSYFIIFASNEGAREWEEALPVENGFVQPPDVDYSSVGLDMILNAVALFFLLELDDMLVTDDDYEVCAEHLQVVLEEYVPDPNINKNYDDNRHNDVKDNEIVGSGPPCCDNCMIPSMYYVIMCFSVFVTLFCYIGGFFAPFVIFFCW